MPASQHQSPLSDIEISQGAKPKRIADVAKDKLGIALENLEPYGHYKAKVSMEFVKSLKNRQDGELADARRRGQDHDDGRPHRCAQLHRQESDVRAARAFARALLRRERGSG